MYKIIVFMLCVITIFTSCTSTGAIINNKYYANSYGNLTPAINSTFTIGNPTHWWESAYIEHLYTANGTIGASNVTTPGGLVDYVAKFNTSTNIVSSDIKDNTTSVYVLDKLNLQGDLYTDRWLNHDTNTFVGVDVAGGDGLRHVGGVDGQGNTALGYKSLYSINTSYYNTAIGYFALTNLTNGLYNTAVGQGALADVTTGQFNTGLGLQALNKNTGNYNTAVGLFAGHTNVVGDNNIFIGAQAGKNELGSNKLYIDSSDTATPLIWGNFSTNNVTIYNNMTVAQTFTLGTPAWDDLQISFSNAKSPASNAPNWVAYKNSEVPAFSKTATNVLYFTAQLPHSYKEGSDLDFHIHITYPDANAGNSTWYFTYSWANIDGTFPGASNSGNVIVSSHSTADYNDMAEIMALISGVGKTVSSILLCSISRLGGDGSDNYDNVIYLVSGDFHYQKDTIGSGSRLTK